MRGFCHLWLPSLLQLLCQKPCLGWDGVRTTLCQPLPCILPKITVSMREALSALDVASINKVHQYLQRSTKDSCTTSAPQTPSIFTLHPRGITATLYLAEKPQYSHGNSSLNSWFWFCLWQFLFAASSRHKDIRVQPYCTLVIKEIRADLICFCLLTQHIPPYLSERVKTSIKTSSTTACRLFL